MVTVYVSMEVKSKRDSQWPSVSLFLLGREEKGLQHFVNFLKIGNIHEQYSCQCQNAHVYQSTMSMLFISITGVTSFELGATT